MWQASSGAREVPLKGAAPDWRRLVEFDPSVQGIELYRTDLAHLPVEDACVDVVMSRSVMEHIEDPLAVYREINRVMKPGGHFVFLTANLWDYAALIASIVPIGSILSSWRRPRAS